MCFVELIELLNKRTVFKDRNILSPHYLPDTLPHRDEHIKKIATLLSPILKSQQVPNILMFGNTGTGKTSTIKYVKKLFDKEIKKQKLNVSFLYLNCRTYNSKYRILLRILRELSMDIDKGGFSISYLYEHLLNKLNKGHKLVIILDEIDMINDLDDVIYSLIRANDEVENGFISLIGISNKIMLKNELDPRSRSSLNEKEIIFSPYNAIQLETILNQRIKLGFKKNAVSPDIVPLIAAITAQENGDVRFGLKLLLKAGEIADERNSEKVEKIDVEKARNEVEYDIISNIIASLPEKEIVLLYSIVKISTNKKIKTFGEEGYYPSGEIISYYKKISKRLGFQPVSSRYYSKYISDLEALGLITTVFSGKGFRGHTRFIKIESKIEDLNKILERRLGLR